MFVLSKLGGEIKPPSKGDIIKHVYTNSEHKNPLCRVISVGSMHETSGHENEAFSYDKEKYKEMLLGSSNNLVNPRPYFINHKFNVILFKLYKMDDSFVSCLVNCGSL